MLCKNHTSPSSYQECHGVTVGSLRALILCLVDVTGITASVSPLERIQNKTISAVQPNINYKDNQARMFSQTYRLDEDKGKH